MHGVRLQYIQELAGLWTVQAPANPSGALVW